jgi:tetratricopeptide (TPR) repeat protein
MNDKYQNPKSKINPKSECQISKPIFYHLLFVLCHYFVICALSFGLIMNAYALNLDKLKIHLLNQDYKSAILEGEKILANSSRSSESDELYYYLGLSYLKDDNYLRASDIFEIILNEFKDSKFKQEACLGLGDTYLLRQDFANAKLCYGQIIKDSPNTKLKPEVYNRFIQVGFKSGDTQLAKEYSDKLKQEFPLVQAAMFNKELCSLSTLESGFFYTVQIGAFSNANNARSLVNKLTQKGYPAYIEEVSHDNKISYRVRVGKLRQRIEAVTLERKLSEEGYPTKICP